MLLEQVLRDAFRDAYQYADSAMLPVIEPFLAVKPKIKNLLLHTYRHFADFSRQFFLFRPYRVVRIFFGGCFGRTGDSSRAVNFFPPQLPFLENTMATAVAVAKTTAEYEAELLSLQTKVAELAALAVAPVKAVAHAYVSKKTGKVSHVVEIRGDFYPISLKLNIARQVAAIHKQIVIAADDCEARMDELTAEAVERYKVWLAKQG